VALPRTLLNSSSPVSSPGAISFQSRYPAGIVTPKIGDAASSACPTAKGNDAVMHDTAIAATAHFRTCLIVRDPYVPRSGPADIDDSLRERLWCLLRHIVTDAAG
jgi:hypothetical protein